MKFITNFHPRYLEQYKQAIHNYPIKCFVIEIYPKPYDPMDIDDEDYEVPNGDYSLWGNNNMPEDLSDFWKLFKQE